MRGVCLVLTVLMLFVSSVYAGDLDDGISTFTDDNISKWDDLGKKDRNVNFIKLKARSQADVTANGSGTASSSGSTSGTGNMNSVVLGAGGTIRGDVIIIDDSSGDKTQIVE